METHDQLTIELEQYKIENEKFVGGNKSAGVRARKGLRLLKKEASELVKVTVQADKDRKEADKANK